MRHTFKQSVRHAIFLAGGPVAMAKQLGVAASLPSMWCTRGSVPPRHRPAIERAVSGRVCVEELGSDVRWTRVQDINWPHPAGRPLADFCAPAAKGATLSSEGRRQ